MYVLISKRSRKKVYSWLFSMQNSKNSYRKLALISIEYCIKRVDRKTKGFHSNFNWTWYISMNLWGSMMEFNLFYEISLNLFEVFSENLWNIHNTELIEFQIFFKYFYSFLTIILSNTEIFSDQNYIFSIFFSIFYIFSRFVRVFDHKIISDPHFSIILQKKLFKKLQSL